ncbi:pantetheine-phosphate adenylyltransferase [Inhella sp.]|uniref:pantetheine-phosphate adenylyltransferase n=1 Tax=Inhella sp. TaxID=1921806 RepID=UPI0035B2D584
MKAIYPGTFDPLTLGHEDILRRAARLFPQVVLAVAVAHHKKTLFSLDERLTMAREALADLPGVEVIAFDGLLADFARAQGAQVLVRGVRSMTDFDYEAQMAGINQHLLPGVETVILTPSEAVRPISGSFVREIARLGGDVSWMVSPTVLPKLAAKRGG